MIKTKAQLSRIGGFTLLEVLVVLGVIASLAALLFPVLGRAREQARITTCTSQLRQIHLGYEMYQQDTDGHTPADLRRLVPRYISDKSLLICPNDPFVKQGGYEWVGFQSQGIPPSDGRPSQSYLYTRLFESIVRDSSHADRYLPPGITPQNKDLVLQTAGYATCQLHGDYIRTRGTSPNNEEFPTVYKGLTLRLCLDGSVRRVHQPTTNNAFGFFYDFQPG